MDHEVRGVGFDDLGSFGLADNVTLSAAGLQVSSGTPARAEAKGNESTMSAPRKRINVSLVIRR